MQGIITEKKTISKISKVKLKAARDGALLGFFLGGTIAVLSLACYAVAQLEDPGRAVGAIWTVWCFLLFNFWYANSQARKVIDAWRAKRKSSIRR